MILFCNSKIFPRNKDENKGRFISESCVYGVVLFHEDEVEVDERAVSEINAGFSTLEAQLRRAGQAEDGAGNVHGNVAWEEAATHLGKVQKQARKLCGLRSVLVGSRDEAGNVHDGAQANEPA